MADGAVIGLAGTLVATVLETVGYHYQAYILQEMRSAFQGSVGGLAYLIGVIVALFHAAMRGNYKFAPWLLIGPPLFFSMVLPTSPAPSAQWIFAGQVQDQSRVEEEVAKTDLRAQTATSNVSTVFARYVELISKTVDEVVKIINSGKDENTNKWFIFKGQLFGRLQTSTVETPGFKELIHHALLTQCSQFVAAAKIVNDPEFGEQAKNDAKAVLTGRERKDLIVTEPVAQYIYQRVKVGQSENLLECVGGLAEPTRIREKPLSCECVWQFVYDGLLEEGRQAVLTVQERAQLNSIDPKAALAKMAEAFGATDPALSDPKAADAARQLEFLSRAVGKYILRNEEQGRSFTGIIAESAEQSQEFGTVEVPLENHLSLTEYSRGRQTEWSEKGRMLMAASNLPYYQGLLLFFLAFSFPFFALLLLVPGKHAGFLMWFTLWLWVKSWDIGFAIVMQVDDLLFSILNLGKEFTRSDLIQQDQLNKDFILAMYALRETDPTFQMSTYYTIIAVCLSAIPVITSQFVMGSISGGVGVIAQGMKLLGDDFASGTKNWAGQRAVTGLRHEINRLVMHRASNYYKNISQYRMAEARRNPAGRLEMGAPERRAAPEGVGKIMGRGYGPTPMPEVTFSNDRNSNRSGENIKESLASVSKRHRDARILEGLFSAAKDPTAVRLGPMRDYLRGGGAVSAMSSAFRDAVRQSLGGAGAKSEAALGDFLVKVTEDRIGPMAAWAQYDTFYSEEGKRLAALGRLYNMIEVPWTQDTGQIAESNYELEYLNQEAKLYANFLEAMGEGGAVMVGYESLTGGVDRYKPQFRTENE